MYKRLQLVTFISVAAAFFLVVAAPFNEDLLSSLGRFGNYLARSSEYFPGQSARTTLLQASTSGKRPGGSMATITVSTSAQLTAALQGAHAGDTILLAAGSYGNFSVSGLSFSSQVTIQSADVTHPAEFRTISVSGSQGLTFEDLNVHFTPDSTTLSFSSAIAVSNSSAITFVHNEIVGGPAVNGVLPTATTLDSTQNVIGLPAGRAMTLANSSNVQVIDNDINTFDRGVVLQHVTGVTIENNDIHDLRRTPIDGGDVSQTVIQGNYLHDLKPWNWGSGDHADFIHIWTVPTSQTTASSGLLIQNNYLAQGGGTAVLGIYLDDNSNGLGFINTQITGNVIYNGNAQGLRLENVTNSSVDGNLLLQSSGELKIGPGILVRDNDSGLSITNNVISGLDMSHLTGSNGNVLVQSIDSSLANFSGLLEGSSLTWLQAMQLREHLSGVASTYDVAPGTGAGIDLTAPTTSTSTDSSTSGTTSTTTSGSTSTTTTGSSGGDTSTSTDSGKHAGSHGSTKGHAVQIARAAEISVTTSATATNSEKAVIANTPSTADKHLVDLSVHSGSGHLENAQTSTLGGNLSTHANAGLDHMVLGLQHAAELSGHGWLLDLVSNPHHDYLI